MLFRTLIVLALFQVAVCGQEPKLDRLQETQPKLQIKPGIEVRTARCEGLTRSVSAAEPLASDGTSPSGSRCFVLRPMLRTSAFVFRINEPMGASPGSRRMSSGKPGLAPNGYWFVSLEDSCGCA